MGIRILVLAESLATFKANTVVDLMPIALIVVESQVALLCREVLLYY